MAFGRLFDVEGRVSLDDKQALAEIKRLEAQVVESIRRMDRQRAVAEIDADADQLEREVKKAEAALTRLERRRATATIDADADQADREIAKVQAKLAALDRERVHIAVELDQAGLRRGNVLMNAMRNHLRRMRGDGNAASNSLRGVWNALQNVRVEMGMFSLSARGMLVVLGTLPTVILNLAGALTSLVGLIGSGIVGATGLAGAALTGLLLVIGGVATGLAANSKHFTRFKDNFKKLGKDWGEATKPGARAFQSVVREALQRANEMLPQFAKRTNQAMRVVAEGAKGFMRMLSGKEGAGNLDQIFANANKAMKPFMAGLTNVGQVLLRIFASFSRHLEPIAKTFEDWTDKLIDATSNTGKLDGQVDKLVGHAKMVGRFFLETGRAIRDVFGAARGEGEPMMRRMTEWMKDVQRWARSGDAAEFFRKAREGSEQLWDALKPIGRVFLEWAEAVRPLMSIFVQLVGHVSRLIAGFVQLTGGSAGLIRYMAAFYILQKAVGWAWQLGRALKALAGITAMQGLANAFAAGGTTGLAAKAFGKGGPGAAGSVAGGAAGGAAAKTFGSRFVAGAAAALRIGATRVFAPAAVVAAALILGKKAGLISGDSWAESAKHSLVSKIPLIGRPVADAFSFVGKGIDKMLGTVENRAGQTGRNISAQIQQGMTAVNFARLDAGLRAFTGRGAQYISHFALQFKKFPRAVDILINMKDRGAAVKLAQLGMQFKAMGRTRVFLNILMNSKNAEQAIRRLEAAKRRIGRREEFEVNADTGRALAAIAKILGIKLPTKTQRLIESGGAGVMSVLQRIAAFVLGTAVKRITDSGTGAGVLSILGSIRAQGFLGVATKVIRTVLQTVRKRQTGGPLVTDAGLERQLVAEPARSQKVTRPKFLVGEEAPGFPEFVIATNPRYRHDNVEYLKDAAHALGVPGFKKGGGSRTGGIGHPQRFTDRLTDFTGPRSPVEAQRRVIGQKERDYDQQDRAFGIELANTEFLKEDGSRNEPVINRRLAQLASLAHLKDAVAKEYDRLASLIQSIIDEVKDLITQMRAGIAKMSDTVRGEVVGTGKRRKRKRKPNERKKQMIGVLKDYQDAIPGLEEERAMAIDDAENTRLDIGDLSANAFAVSGTKPNLTEADTGAAAGGDADSTGLDADQAAIAEQLRTQLATATRYSEIDRAALATFAGPGDIGGGGVNAYAAAGGQPWGGMSLLGSGGGMSMMGASGVGGAGEGGGPSVVQYNYMMHPSDPAVLREIGEAATKGQAGQPYVGASRVSLGI